jgi:hypothetical protein
MLNIAKEITVPELGRVKNVFFVLDRPTPTADSLTLLPFRVP